VRRVPAALAVLAVGVLLMVPASGLGTHVRVKGASPLHTSLVPAYQPCPSPDREHGPPLAFPSCSGPQQTSSYLTVGTPDANGNPAQSVGSFVWTASAGTPGPPTDNKISFKVDITDVRCRSAGPACPAPGADYAGSVEVRLPWQITDHNNNVAPGGGSDPATTQWFDFAFTVLCTMTSDPSIGSKCSRHIGYIEEFGFAIPDGRRTQWEVGQVEIRDGGADADASTAGDNTRFAVQGVFIP
jgi:hypothetical protein